MAWRRVAQDASDHNVPTQASRNNAIGAMQIGCLSNCRNDLTSRNGIRVISNAAPKIATSDVDHGSDSATRTAQMSTVVSQAAGSRQRRTGSVSGAFPAIAVTVPLLVSHDRPARWC